jgi:WD40 repeat protein
MSPKETGTGQEVRPPPPVGMPAGSQDDSPSTIVAPSVTSNSNEPQSTTLPTVAPTSCPDATSSATPSASPDLQPSVAFAPVRAPDRYQILAEHGRGGIGRVSRAHDRELGRDVAIKELISRGTVAEARFLREATITARLEHPGIVPVHEAGRWPDGTPFYAMKLVSGRPLRELILERTTVDQRLGLLHHVIAVADAISYAHGRNIIHRDLKPANVIVGEFGETIVIDWGLAKVLSASYEPTVGDGPIRIHHDHDRDLTTAGAVLGTPSYMAPEQERGEQVDQRADVFAIGAMLWELCSLHKVPPTNLRQRHPLLRRDGIDHDLIVILDKALAPHPSHRYADAGALAADLKAFKAGARIAARRYTLWALLSRWTRHHRPLAITIAASLVFAFSGMGLYVRNIAAERDRADASQRAATGLLDNLTLKHAELLLTTDPSAALDSIASYRGDHIDYVRQMRAEALARGVAVVRAVPHAASVRWIQGIAVGGILTLSSDGTVSRTAPDGTSVVLVRNVKRGADFAYSASSHVLAYVCEPEDLCLLEITTGRSLHVPPKDPSYEPRYLSFSPGDSELALLSPTGDLRVFDVDFAAFPALPVERFHVRDVHPGGLLFVNRDAIATSLPEGFALTHRNGEIQEVIAPDGTLWDTGPVDHDLVYASSKGDLFLVSTDNPRITKRARVCHDAVSGLKSLPAKQAVAYACKEGTVGIWTPANGTIKPVTHLEGHANLLEVSPSGDYLVAAGDNGVLAVSDLQTGITSSLKGQGFELNVISAPTPDYPFLLSADIRGGVRAWPLPDRAVRVIADFGGLMFSAIFDDQNDSVIVVNRDVPILRYSAAASIQPAGAHGINQQFLERSPGGHRLATYGPGGVEVWSLSPLARLRALDPSYKSISHAAFIGETDDLAISSRGGDLLRWSSEGPPRLVHHFAQAIETFVYMQHTGFFIVATADGTLSRIDGNLRQVQLQPPGSSGAPITFMLSLPDGRLVGVGRANGESFMIDTISGQLIPLPRALEGIRDISATPDGRLIAVASDDGTVHLGEKHSNTWLLATWRTLRVHVRKIAFTDDGLLIVACTDGTVWLYSSVDHAWQCRVMGTTQLTQIVLDTGKNTAYILDADGRLLSVDIGALTTELYSSETMSTSGSNHEKRTEF